MTPKTLTGPVRHADKFFGQMTVRQTVKTFPTYFNTLQSTVSLMTCSKSGKKFDEPPLTVNLLESWRACMLISYFQSVAFDEEVRSQKSEAISQTPFPCSNMTPEITDFFGVIFGKRSFETKIANTRKTYEFSFRHRYCM